MLLVERLIRFYRRFYYPVSLPEEVAVALGIDATSKLTFSQFISLLSSPDCSPKKLSKFMSREQAEAAFDTALKKERFPYHSLFSYYFNNGWMGFYLQFDQADRLRRVYIKHKKLSQDEGIELDLMRLS